MARARNIKPGLCKNEDLAECSIWARYLFACLPMWADRDGRLEDRPKRLKMEIFPADNVDMDALLTELATHGTPAFLVRYRNSDGSFIQISRFSTHQTPHYSEKASVIKPPGLQELLPHEATGTPGVHQETTVDKEVSIPGELRRTPKAQPPSLLIPDSLIPDSLQLPASSDESLSAAKPLNGHANGEEKGVIGIPLVGDSEFQITAAMVSEFEKLYPALDVLQTLREVRGWNLSNPTRRKTKSGVLRHVNAWLAKEQNKAP